jgi:hypothetical protein
MIIVRELMGRVRNVVLIKCIFESGKPKGAGILGGRAHGSNGGTGELVYEQPGDEVDGSCHKGGFQVSRKGVKGEQRGAKGKHYAYNLCFAVYIMECLE